MSNVIQPRTTVQLLGEKGAGNISNPVIVAPPPPDQNQGTLIFDDTFWENNSFGGEPSGNATWISDGGGAWTTTANDELFISLVPISSGENLNWQLGYRPTGIRITFSTNENVGVTTFTVNVSSENETLAEQFSVPNPSSGNSAVVNMALDFSADEDIELLSVEAEDGTQIAISISEILFFE